jgi:hypothetical protein
MGASFLAVIVDLVWLADSHSQLQVGYYVWMASFGLLFVFAATMDWRTRRACNDSVRPRCA